jgi:hypothetical protein
LLSRARAPDLIVSTGRFCSRGPYPDRRQQMLSGDRALALVPGMTVGDSQPR